MFDLRLLFVLALVVGVAGCGDAQPPTTPTPRPGPSVPVTPVPPQPAPEPTPGESIAGLYRLDLSIGESCTGLPEVARQRTYTATIAPAGAHYVVTLSDASFLAGGICTFAPSKLGCDQFLASRVGDQVRFDMINENDDGHGGHIVEFIPPSTWIEVIGTATGDVKDGNMTAAGTASVWYCRDRAGYPFPCGSFGGCGSDLLMKFTRK